MNVNFKDTRLVEAFDCIDPKYIAEVGESLKLRSVRSKGEEYKKQPFSFHVKQILALVGCLILLSVAFPTVNYAVKFINSFAASWGSVATEDSQTETFSETIDSPYERAIDAYPEGMSAEEIYADVLKGGWVVQDGDLSLEFDAGEDIWLNFLYSVDNKTPISFLFADISDHIVQLSEINFNGDTFVIKQQFRSNGSIIENECKEFCYLIKSEKLGRKYFFANHPDAEPLPLSSDEISLYDVEANFVVVWVD
jgi:hypothetical protein